MFALGAIVSLCYVPGFTGAFIATQWAVLSIVLPFFLWRAGTFTPFHIAGLLFLAYAAVSVPTSPIPADGVYGLWMLCVMGLSFWLGSTLSNLRELYAGLALGVSVSSIVAVAQFNGFAGVPYVSDTPAGLYANAVAQGLICALVIVALVSERMWAWVPWPLYGLALSSSRGAWFAAGVGLAAVFIRHVWILFAAIGVAFVFLFMLPLSKSDAIRLSIWSTTVDNLTWFGWGSGSFFSWLLWRGGVPFYPEYAHNDALQLVFEYGVATAIPIGIFTYALTRTTEREWPLLVTFAVASCYSMPLWVPVASFMAFVSLGRVAGTGVVARIYGDNRGQHVVSRQRGSDEKGRGFVSVVSNS